MKRLKNRLTWNNESLLITRRQLLLLMWKSVQITFKCYVCWMKKQFFLLLFLHFSPYRTFKRRIRFFFLCLSRTFIFILDVKIKTFLWFWKVWSDQFVVDGADGDVVETVFSGFRGASGRTRAAAKEETVTASIKLFYITTVCVFPCVSTRVKRTFLDLSYRLLTTVSPKSERKIEE